MTALETSRVATPSRWRPVLREFSESPGAVIALAI